MKPLIRINDPQLIDTDLIDKELKAGKEVLAQFSRKVYDQKKLGQLNELCGKYDEDFGIRFYGHYTNSFDFETLLKIPNVKSLYVDCLTKAHNVEAISQLQNLQKLSLGVYNLNETEILNLKNLKNLSELTVTETKTKAFNLEYLRDYKNLKLLTIGGHTKNLEAVGTLENLNYLSLNSVKKASVSFVNKLKKLKTLKFILGGMENIHEIGENEIENLHISWVRGFNDIGNISSFRKLKTLLIEDNIQLQAVDFDGELPYLSDLKILNCKNLSSLTGLERLPSLHQLRIYKTALEFDKLIKQPLPKNLKIFAFYKNRQEVDKNIKITLEAKGYSEW